MKNNTLWLNPLVPYGSKLLLISVLLIVLSSYSIKYLPLVDIINKSLISELETYLEMIKYISIATVIFSVIIVIVGLLMNHKVVYSLADDSIAIKSYKFKLSDIAKLRIDSETKRESMSLNSASMVNNTYYSLVIYYFLNDYTPDEKEEFRRLYNDNPDEFINENSSYNKKALFGDTHSISLGNTRALKYLIKNSKILGRAVSLPIKNYSVGTKKVDCFV